MLYVIQTIYTTFTVLCIMSQTISEINNKDIIGPRKPKTVDTIGPNRLVKDENRRMGFIYTDYLCRYYNLSFQGDVNIWLSVYYSGERPSASFEYKILAAVENAYRTYSTKEIRAYVLIEGVTSTNTSSATIKVQESTHDDYPPMTTISIE